MSRLLKPIPWAAREKKADITSILKAILIIRLILMLCSRKDESYVGYQFLNFEVNFDTFMKIKSIVMRLASM
jgi:hypothetical protein